MPAIHSLCIYFLILIKFAFIYFSIHLFVFIVFYSIISKYLTNV